MGDRRGWLAVAAAFAVPAATMFALKMLTAGASEQSSAWLRRPTAVTAGWAVRAAGVPVVIANGTDLVLRNHILRIDLACTAFDWFILFIVAIAVVPVAARRKRTALLIGLPAIVVLNIVRLVMVALVSEHAPQQFYFVHDVVLQASMAILVATMWVVFLWISKDDWAPGWR